MVDGMVGIDWNRGNRWDFAKRGRKKKWKGNGKNGKEEPYLLIRGMGWHQLFKPNEVSMLTTSALNALSTCKRFCTCAQLCNTVL